MEIRGHCSNIGAIAKYIKDKLGERSLTVCLDDQCDMNKLNLPKCINCSPFVITIEKVGEDNP